jgi:NAD(P) transhydrogenase
MNLSEYDVLVIGTGPAGQKAAISAAKARNQVAIGDLAVLRGGVSVHTGTIPSKAIREAIFQLSGLAVKALYGDGFRSRGISVQDVAFRVSTIVDRETEVIRAQLARNRIMIYHGVALFLDPHTVEVHGQGTSVKGEKILVACGARPAHSPEIPFDSSRIVDTDHLHALSGLPKEIIVVGAGVVGLEYASFMAVLGADVSLIDQRPTILEFVDRQIGEAPSYHLRQLGVTFRLAEKVTHVGIDPVARSGCCRSGERQENPSRRAGLCRWPPSQWRPAWPGCCRTGFKGNSKHVAGRQPTLLHRGACPCRESNNVASRVDMRNVGLKELIYFQPAARVH